MALRSLKNLNLQNLENTESFRTLQRKLKEDKWYGRVLDYTEESTKVDRVYLATVTVFVLLASLVINYGLELICGSVGFLYPAYKTIASLEKADNESARRWLTYWLVFAAFNFLQIFLFFLYWLPGYWLIKCLFYYWCYAPISRNGSELIYSYLIQPIFRRNQQAIDDALNNIAKTAHTIYTESDGNGHFTNAPESTTQG
ncbi:receptor expression-enhancing protein 5-like [Uloborus diversus]|uniref:receptor expression-enhancing protein 5-like n=1 Tax=Uloborus diversus TaxID=327109 RepID=UPI0024092D67|nr:receptor expression-enhancing protein 5-like [Uloborus diversus]